MGHKEGPTQMSGSDFEEQLRKAREAQQQQEQSAKQASQAADDASRRETQAREEASRNLEAEARKVELEFLNASGAKQILETPRHK
jgi:hypothetical protein